MAPPSSKKAARSAKPSSKKMARRVTKPRKASTAKAKPTKKAPKGDGGPNGAVGVEAWIADVKPEHRAIVKRLDALIRKTIPGIQRHVKWRKPSQPLGVPFYGVPGQGWIAAMWSFKDRVGIAFFAGNDLQPRPPLVSVSQRRVDIHDESEYDEAQLRSWLQQARELPGWGKGSAELR